MFAPTRTTREEVLDGARRWAAEHGRSPKFLDWGAPGTPGYRVVYGLWPSWDAMLKEAGLELLLRCPPPVRCPPRFTRERVIEQLQAFAKQHGRSPRSGDLEKAPDGLPNRSTIRALFVTHEKALEAAGLPHPNPWREDEAILRALRADAKRRKRLPTFRDWGHANKSHPAANTVALRFGSWRAGLVAAGLNPDGRDHPWTRDEVLDAIIAWRGEHGRWPWKVDWDRGAPGRPAAQCAARVAGGGSFVAAVEAARAKAIAAVTSASGQKALGDAGLADHSPMTRVADG